MDWNDVERMFGPDPMVAYDASAELADREHRLSVVNGVLRVIDEDCDGDTCWTRQGCQCADWDFSLLRWVTAAERYREEAARRYKAGDLNWDRQTLGPWTRLPALREFSDREADRFERFNREPIEWRREYLGEWNARLTPPRVRVVSHARHWLR